MCPPQTPIFSTCISAPDHLRYTSSTIASLLPLRYVININLHVISSMRKAFVQILFSHQKSCLYIICIRLRFILDRWISNNYSCEKQSVSPALSSSDVFVFKKKKERTIRRNKSFISNFRHKCPVQESFSYYYRYF